MSKSQLADQWIERRVCPRAHMAEELVGASSEPRLNEILWCPECFRPYAGSEFHLEYVPWSPVFDRWGNTFGPSHAYVKGLGLIKVADTEDIDMTTHGQHWKAQVQKPQPVLLPRLPKPGMAPETVVYFACLVALVLSLGVLAAFLLELSRTW